VNTSRGPIKAGILVGADGVNSLVARRLGLSSKRRVLQALEAEVYYHDFDRLTDFHDRIYFDFGVVPYGYAWVFPKKDHLSVGLTTHNLSIKDLRPYWAEYLERRSLATGYQVRSMHAALIPVGPEPQAGLSNKCGLLIGDAAGLTDPITAEGLYYAFKSTMLASEIIFGALEDGWGMLPLYTKMMAMEFYRDLTAADKIGRLLYQWPRLGHWLMRVNGQKLGQYMIKVMAGEVNYADILKKARHPYNWLKAVGLAR
ncbi:MAG: NAD(P)/FAD-dependent oxidoreductase, partial [Deltaproteobacteria bacterium]|nr:NAD(P)/FAD-dependent oxidoreductase [Deltaproteobacteria bacterium]